MTDAILFHIPQKPNAIAKFTGTDAKNADLTCEAGPDDTQKGVQSCENSTVFPSLPLAINWLRDNIRKNQSVRYQVIVNSVANIIQNAKINYILFETSIHISLTKHGLTFEELNKCYSYSHEKGELPF